MRKLTFLFIFILEREKIFVTYNSISYTDVFSYPYRALLFLHDKPKFYNARKH